MTDTVFSLGGIDFADFEVPASIPFGGEQMLAIHKLVGGARIIDALGRDDAPIEWAGRFRGADAVTRAKALDQMRIDGKPVALTWDEFAFTVVVRRFTGNFERFYEVPYSISVEVLTDDAQADAEDSPDDVDAMAAADQDTAAGLADRIGDPPLSSLVSTLGGAVSAVQNFATATQTTINGVLAPITAVRARVSDLIDAAEGSLSGSAIAGVLPGLNPTAMVAGLAGSAAAMGDAADLYDLDNAVARMARNVGAIGVSGADVVKVGGDLYRMAMDAYGDATAWPTIAKANGLTDPVLLGLQTLRVPPLPGDTGGILSA